MAARRHSNWLWLLVVAGVVLIVWQLWVLFGSLSLPVNDWVQYWSAGRVFVSGGNPYDMDALYTFQKQAGSPHGRAIRMYSPPWILPLLAPFGLLDYRVGWLLWFFLHFGLIAACALGLWRYYGGASQRGWLAWVLAFTFLPSIFVLAEGQIGAVILLGLWGFLHFERKRRDWLVGVSLFLLMLKPQLTYLIWIPLVLWVWENRRFKIVLGATFVLLGALVLMMNLRMFSAYFALLGVAPPTAWATPTLGNLLRYLFGPTRVWLGFVPALLASGAVLGWYLQRRATWDWAKTLPYLLFFSLWTAPHSWTFDYIILLAPLLAAALQVRQLPAPRAWGVAAMYLGIEAGMVAMQLLKFPNFAFIWVLPALLVLYCLTMRAPSRAASLTT